MKVGIVGASGYSGEILVKLLLGHPRVTLTAVTSRTHAGKPLSAVIPSVRGLDRGLKFVDSDPIALAASDVALFSRCRTVPPRPTRRRWSPRENA
jgi:N-acetyl-gamma-glutamyl-phosphate reductase